jgi:HAE1 family hydrophobic/amphiphilic exporter-1
MNLIDTSVERPVLTTVMILALLVFGIWAYPRIGVDQFPDVEFPVATVTITYPGADPSTIESKVIEPLEEQINAVNGIDQLRSTSAESVGIITVQFKLERDADKAVQDVRDKVNAAVGELPEDAEKPIVQKFDVGAAPIMSLVLSGPQQPRELTEIADEHVKQQLQSLQGVGNIEIVGGQEREFRILIDPVKLDTYGLTVSDVSRAISAQNIEIPGGRIETAERELAVKTTGEVHSAQELRDLIVTNSEGRDIQVDDVAQVIDGKEEKRSHAQLNGQSAVSLTIQKQSGTNTVAVAERLHEELEVLREQLHSEFGEDLTIEVPVDNSVFIETSIHHVQFDLFYGGILAVLIIFAFLRDWRATIISALALPTSVIATFAFIYLMGFTFNTMTMLALTLSIGILIDDAIVVIENIHRHLEMGKPPMQAAQEGTKEIGLAVLAITASIVAVFVPVATMGGIIGRFFFQFGMTVAFAVTVSLFVAFTLTPMLSARVLKRDHGSNAIGEAIEKVLSVIENAYRSLIRGALNHPIVTSLVAVGSLAGAIGLATVIPTEFVPAEDRGEFRIYAEMPSGTKLDETIAYTDRITERVREVPGVELTFATIGSGARGEINKGVIHVEMVPVSERSFSQNEAMVYVRDTLEPFDAADIAIEPIEAVGGGGNERQGDIQYILMGSDYDELTESAREVVRVLEDKEGFVDVDTSVSTGKPEVHLEVDRQRASDLGVSVAAIGTAIRTLYAGDKISEVSTDGERYDARVRLKEAFRDDPAKLLDLSVRSSSGRLVALSNIVSIEEATGPSQIEHYNRQKQVTVLANLEDLALGSAMGQMRSAVEDTVPDTIEATTGGNAENLQETAGYMIEALILAVVLTFLILSAQFESFIHPLTIMLSLPLSLIGALGALALTGMSLNIFTMIGFIMLMGLVTKNAVLLVDYTNVLRRRDGMERFEALVEAGAVRLRPILMTTAAMIFGMIPVATATGAGGGQRAPMAVAVIGGLITSTLLTLVVVPVAYDWFDRLAAWLPGAGGETPAERDAAVNGTP